MLHSQPPAARSGRARRALEDRRFSGDVALQRAVGNREQQLAGGGDAHLSSSGTSSMRRSFHERSANSAS